MKTSPFFYKVWPNGKYLDLSLEGFGMEYCAKRRPRLKLVHLKTIDSFFGFFGNQFGSLNLKKIQIKSKSEGGS
jgi:hypothetical protein